jgi:hypothetical protein
MRSVSVGVRFGGSEITTGNEKMLQPGDWGGSLSVTDGI